MINPSEERVLAARLVAGRSAGSASMNFVQIPLAFVVVSGAGGDAMSETRKLAAIMVTDIVGYSRLAGADEERTLARIRGLRSDLVEPTVAAHRGRVVKRTGDGSIIEFRSVVDAVRCAIEVQNGMVERNAGVPPERRIEFRIGVHLGDVVEESDGDLMGDGVNIAARLESVAKPGAICLSEQAYWQVKGRLDLKVTDLGATQLKNIAEPIRVYSLEVGQQRKRRLRRRRRQRLGAARRSSGGDRAHRGEARLRASCDGLCRRQFSAHRHLGDYQPRVFLADLADARLGRRARHELLERFPPQADLGRRDSARTGERALDAPHSDGIHNRHCDLIN